MRKVGSLRTRVRLQNLLLAIKATLLLTFGPIIVVGHVGLGIVGGLLGCPYPIPFFLCQICPTPCTFRLIRPWLFGVILTTSLLAGRVFCGILCPFGIMSSLLFSSPVKKLSAKGVEDRVKYIRYGVLILFLYLMGEAAGILLGVWTIGSLWSLLIAYRGVVTIVTIPTVLVLLISSIFIYRPWCRYLCPLGTLLLVSNRYSLLSLERDDKACGECDACLSNCPLSLPDLSDSTDCMRCLSCYTACKRGTMRLVNRSRLFHR